MNHRTALVLGITGSAGAAIARALLAHGWRVRALHREPERARGRWQGPALEWRRGDALDAEAVRSAAAGAALLVHAVNPPGYRNWRGLALPMLANAIAAARASGARLLLPGNVYNYGPNAWPRLAEDSPQRPLTGKGQVRVEMEAMLRDAAADGVRSLILRAGDFFGPGSGSSWIPLAMVKPGRPLRAVVYPGRHDAGHAWAYLPDLAETCARLADREAELPDFARFHFRGHYLAQGVEMAQAIRAVADAPTAPIRRFPWWLLRLAGPVNETLRELREMRYLWEETLELDNTALLDFLGSEPHTPLDIALTATLGELGCLAPATAQPRAVGG